MYKINNEEYMFNELGFVRRDTEITKREKDILTLIASGKTNKEISCELNLKPSTVRNYISNIFRKLKIVNRSQATALAIYSGLLSANALDENLNGYSFLKEL